MENKNITNTGRFLITIWNVGLFALIWFFYYNTFAFDKFWLPGGLISCLVHFIIYSALCNLYQAFRIASNSVWDVVFGQTISFGIADAILYAECCLVYNQYVNIFPGLATAVLQIAGTIFIVSMVKRYMVSHITPRKTLILYGRRASEVLAEQFANRLLEKYKHLFQIIYVEYDRIADEKLETLLEECEVVILYEVSEEKRGQFMKRCTELKKNLYFTPRVEDIICQGASTKSLLDTPLLKYEYKSGYFGKKFFDVAISLVLLILVSPILLVTMAAIKIEDHGPIFFKQKRCTKDGRVFEILKFRSMIVDAEKAGVTPCTGNDPRITKVGKIIRATRIDELPQLLNVLNGDMSFVGPRPERVEHVEEYSKALPEFAYRMRVNGGLTGYAQIYGKYNTSAYDKLRLDLMYIENQSLLLDLKILLLTIRTIFTPEATEGFSEERSEAMQRRMERLEKYNELMADSVETK